MAGATRGIAGTICIGILLVRGGPAEARRPRVTPRTGEAAPGTGRAAALGTDASVVARLHRLGRLEIVAGRLAGKQAKAEEVRTFGTRLAEEHQAIEDRLLTWVTQNELPQEALERVAPEDARFEAAPGERLRELPAERFDREFLSTIVRAHDRAIELVSGARDQVASFDLRALLQDTMPTLMEHRASARRLLEALDAGPRARVTPGRR